MIQKQLENLFVMRTLGDTPSIWRFSLGEALVLFIMNLAGIFGFPPSLLFWFSCSLVCVLFSKGVLSKLRPQKFWGIIYWYLPSWITPFKKKKKNGGGLSLSSNRYFLR